MGIKTAKSEAHGSAILVGAGGVTDAQVAASRRLGRAVEELNRALVDAAAVRTSLLHPRWMRYVFTLRGGCQAEQLEYAGMVFEGQE